MKKFIIALLGLALLVPNALAISRNEAASLAQEVVGGNATAVRTELEDGVYEVALRGDGTLYQVDILNASGAILKIETTYAGTGRGRSFKLSKAQARDAAAASVPEAAGGIVTAERDEGESAYEIFYSTDGAVGDVVVNAETGAIQRTTSYPEAVAQGILSTDEIVQLLAQRLTDAEIVELELDWDDGRYVLDGEALANGARYSFEINAVTGTLIKLERDD